MEDSKKMLLTEAGMNLDEALERFMNNETMLDKFLKRFPDEPSYKAMIDAVNAGDNKAAFETSHTLKGVVANFSFTELAKASSDACEDFRAGNFEAGKAKIPHVTTLYEKTVEKIREIYGL